VALAESNAGGADEWGELLDLIRPEAPWPARQALVTGLAQWSARGAWNATLLRALLVEKKWTAEEADEFLWLLRAPVSPVEPDSAALDKALAALTSRRAPIRAAALWNLLVADSGKWVPPPRANEAAEADPDSIAYKGLVAELTKRVAELKKRSKGPP
jgi:hypothetical protein